MKLKLMKSPFSFYTKLLKTRPIVGNCLSGFVIFGIGDFLCQIMEIKAIKKSGKIEIKRILKSCLFGVVVAPYLYMQYGLVVPRLFPGKDLISKLKGILYAITISDSIFNFSYFLFMSLLNKKEFNSSFTNDIMEKFVPVQMFSIKIWFFLTSFNFLIIPIHLRVAFDNTLSIFWNMFLSYVENNK